MKISTYKDFLMAYNEHTNIYSKNAYDKLDFHIEDSLTLANLIGDCHLRIADFGSGSGLPAIILAIANPNNIVFAIESKSRKTRFLNQVVSELGLENVSVVNENLYEWVRRVDQPFDIITAKAFGSVDKITDIAKSIVLSGHSKLFIPYSRIQANSVDASFIVEQSDFIYYSKTF
tara:strand:- start:226 stop:750 length:525 start_codon:yes stop_codon:yes gene_type:complete